jgi:hypothetical protein
MNRIKKFDQYRKLYESLSRTTFHFTQLTNLVQILRTNSLRASIAFGTKSDDKLNKGKPYFVSFSTTGNAKIGYGRSLAESGGKVTIVFDGDALSNLGPSSPVEYWNVNKDPKKSKINDITRYDEHEERLFLDKPIIQNVSRYIKEIHVYVGKLDDRYFEIFNECWALATKLDIYFYPYDNEPYYNHLHRKGANVEDQYNAEWFQKYLKHANQPEDAFVRGLFDIISLYAVMDDDNTAKVVTILKKDNQLQLLADKYNTTVDKLIHSYVIDDIKPISRMSHNRWTRVIEWGTLPDNHYRKQEIGTSVSNDFHNIKEWASRYPTVMKWVHTVWRDIKKNGGGTLKGYMDYKAKLAKSKHPDQFPIFNNQ